MSYKPWAEINTIVYLHDRRCDLAKLNTVILTMNQTPEKYFRLYTSVVRWIDNLDVGMGDKIWYNVMLQHGHQLLKAIEVIKNKGSKE